MTGTQRDTTILRVKSRCTRKRTSESQIHTLIVRLFRRTPTRLAFARRSTLVNSMRRKRRHKAAIGFRTRQRQHVSLIIADIGALRAAGSGGRLVSPGMQHTELIGYKSALLVCCWESQNPGGWLDWVRLTMKKKIKESQTVFICFNHQNGWIPL